MALPSLQERAAAALQSLTPIMMGAAVGSVLVLGLAGVMVRAMRGRASAATRHEVWLLGFAGVLLIPVLWATLPRWHILPRVGATHARSAAGALVESAVASPVLASARSGDQAAHSVPGRETTMTTTTTMKTDDGSPVPQSVGPAPMAAKAPAAPQHQSPSAAPTPERKLPGRSWALVCWLVGSVLALCRLALGHLNLWSLRWRRAGGVTRVTGGTLFDLLAQLRGKLGLRRRVVLLSSSVRTMPMTWGLWRARLLVPEQAASWPPAQRRDVLLHELGHVKRWDCLAQFLSQVACAVYWFNPLAWMAERRMQIEREHACDDLVLNSGAEAPSYARHLLQSVSPSVVKFRLATAAVAMSRPSTLEERMRAILNPCVNRRALTARSSLVMTFLLLGALVPAAMLRAQQDPTPPPTGNGRAIRPAQRGGGGGDDSGASPATRPTRGDSQPGRFGGGGGPGGRLGFQGFGSAAAPALGEGPTCSFDATIYDVRIPVDQIGRLDVEALVKASETAEGFENALKALGPVKPMYRANQFVRLSGDTITIGSEVPIVTSSRQTERGQTMNTIQYQSTGAVFSVAGQAAAGGMDLDVDLGIQVSSATESAAVISENVNASIMRRTTLSHKGPVQPRKPFVVVSVDAGAVDKEGKAVAYIGRITIGEPQSSASSK
jgi:beta-lactamase regulating signal transducer with metallopeptidase domain